MRSTKGLATTLMVLVPVGLLFGVIRSFLQPTEWTYDGGQVGADRDGWSALGIPIGVATIVVALIWVYRVAANARLVGDPSRPSPGWALGSWFIPVAHAVLPYFPLRTAWDESRAGSGAVVALWGIGWALYVTSVYVTLIWGTAYGFQAGMEAASGGGPVTIEMPAAMVAVGWTGQALAVVTGALFLVVVWRLSQAQEAMQRRHTAPLTAAPAFAGGGPPQ